MATSSKPDPLLKVRGKLYNIGFESVSKGPTKSSLIVDGARVAVRVANPSNGKWQINLHSHGVLDENGIDAYLFCLQSVPGNAAMPLYLIFPAPLERIKITFTLSSLMRIYAGNIENWHILRAATVKAA